LWEHSYLIAAYLLLLTQTIDNDHSSGSDRYHETTLYYHHLTILSIGYSYHTLLVSATPPPVQAIWRVASGQVAPLGEAWYNLAADAGKTRANNAVGFDSVKGIV
jgi:hypothetical protein